MIDPPQPHTALAERPVFRGKIVPYVAEWKGDIPDFKALHAGRLVECIMGQKCAICGDRLGNFCAFIGGPACKISRVFSDPGMHEACARLATVSCPFVGKGKEYSKSTQAKGNRELVPGAFANTTERPSVMYLFLSPGYYALRIGDSLHVQSEPFISTERIREWTS